MYWTSNDVSTNIGRATDNHSFRRSGLCVAIPVKYIYDRGVHDYLGLVEFSYCLTNDSFKTSSVNGRKTLIAVRLLILPKRLVLQSIKPDFRGAPRPCQSTYSPCQVTKNTPIAFRLCPIPLRNRAVRMFQVGVGLWTSTKGSRVGVT